MTSDVRFASMKQLRPQDWVLVLGLAFMPLIAVVAHKGLVVILIIMGSVAFWSVLTEQRLASVFTRSTLLFCGVGIVWLIVASVMSPDPLAGVVKTLQITGLGVLFLGVASHLRTLPPENKANCTRALVWGALAAFVFIIAGYLAVAVFDQDVIEIQRAKKITVLYPGFIVLSLLLPGVFGYFQQKKRMLAVWGIAVVALLLSIAIDSMLATVLVALTVFLYVLFRNDPWQLPRVLALLLVVMTVTLPISMPLILDRVAVVFVQDENGSTDEAKPVVGSVAHHYEIWRFAADRAAERPFLGWGLDSSRALPGGHRLLAENAELLPLHPHNAVLQIWLELGVPGLMLLCVVMWRTYMPPGWESFSRREVLIRTLTVSAAFVAASATFGIWQSWWLSAIALALASTSLWHEGEV